MSCDRGVQSGSLFPVKPTKEEMRGKLGLYVCRTCRKPLSFDRFGKWVHKDGSVT